MKQTITCKELASIVGVSERWLRVLAARGLIPAPADGAWPTEETLRRLFTHYRAGGADEIRVARLRKLEDQHAEHLARMGKWSHASWMSML